MKKIKTYKFGGAVLSTIPGFHNMLKIISESADTKILLVVSAFSKSTRNLKEAGLSAADGDIDKSYQIIENLIEDYLYFVNNLNFDASVLNALETDILSTKSDIFRLLKGISIIKEITPRTLDLLMSFGEKISLNIAYNYLKLNGVAAYKVDSSEIIKTNSNFGNAVPNLKVTAENIKNKVIPLFEKNNVIITQGFVASDFDNEITTMGLESSNLSAAIYSKFLNCNEIVLFTDVNGVRNCDPKENTDSILLKYLSYSQAYLLGINGLKLIFPRMVRFAKKANITIKIKSGLEFNDEETIISDMQGNENLSVKIDCGLRYLYKVNVNQNSDYFIYRDKKIKFPKNILKQLINTAELTTEAKNLKFRIISMQAGSIILEFDKMIEIKGIKKYKKTNIVYLNSRNIENKYGKNVNILLISNGTVDNIYRLQKL